MTPPSAPDGPHSGTPVPDPALSPFVEPLRSAVTDPLCALLGIDSVPVDWAVDERGLRARAGATVRADEYHGAWPPPRQGEVRLRLEGLVSRQLKLTFEERRDDPAARRLRSRIRQRMQHPAELAAPLTALTEALERWRPFRDLRDEDFRRIYPSPSGRYAQLRVGYRCNQDCWFCWQGRSWPAPPPERFSGWIDELAGHSVGSVNFTGGEPTTYPLLPELIARATGHGMQASIQTNAIALAQPRYLQRLLDAGLSVAMVSYHSADAAISDAMTRAPNTHERTVEGVRAALAAGVTVVLTCVVERANVAGLEAHATDIVERFVRPFSDNPVQRVSYAHPTDYFERGAWARQQVPYDEIAPHLVAAARTLRAASVPVQTEGPCGFPLCVLRNAPELVRDRVLSRDLFSEQDVEYRAYPEPCDECARRGDCFGLRAEYVECWGARGLRPFAA